jgi:hypothetical protein
MKINTAALSEQLASRLQPPPRSDYAESMWEAFECLIENIYCLRQLGYKQAEVLAMLKEEPAMSSMTVKTFSRYYQRAIKNAATLRRCKVAYAELMATGKIGGDKNDVAPPASPPPVPVALTAPAAQPVIKAVEQPPAPPVPSGRREETPKPPAVAVVDGKDRLTRWYPVSEPLPLGKFRPLPISKADRNNPDLQFARPRDDPENPPEGFWDADKLFEHPFIDGLLLDYIERRYTQCLNYFDPNLKRNISEFNKYLNRRRIWGEPPAKPIPEGSTPFILGRILKNQGGK